MKKFGERTGQCKMSKEEIKEENKEIQDENLDNFFGLYDQYKKNELELLKKRL